MTKHIVHIVTNTAHYADASHATGLWLSELTHAWHEFAEKGYTQTLVSPKGGAVPLEPRSLKWPNLDSSARKWLDDPASMTLLQTTKTPGDVDPATVDALYFTGGHAVMYDFSDPDLAQLTRAVWEAGGVVASVCHGYCGLLDVTLADGSYLIAGRRMTGFSWCEEELAGVAKLVPYNAEERAKERGGKYEKNLVPFTSRAVVDGRLVTGQNPQSARATAVKVIEVLEGGKAGKGPKGEAKEKA
ncbi:hypothetical protein CspeluHIS016_0210940 [Cutaneotrichosporon spelunceum]|uniref:D-lactate dehydratase n=1 Tax=Cutaneotrichosporon spelunceum TaxID=1672016 RepID=A0AAD3TSD4_9TREE|nr:hypothetical protein CspeluHIS016_0210940 [Cutaneotrichosporon spelunceum]